MKINKLRKIYDKALEDILFVSFINIAFTIAVPIWAIEILIARALVLSTLMCFVGRIATLFVDDKEEV